MSQDEVGGRRNAECLRGLVEPQIKGEGRRADGGALQFAPHGRGNLVLVQHVDIGGNFGGVGNDLAGPDGFTVGGRHTCHPVVFHQNAGHRAIVADLAAALHDAVGQNR